MLLILQRSFSIILVFAIMFGLTTCGGNYLKEDEVDSDFEQDYALINEITEYLLSLEENPVYIDVDTVEIEGRYGEPMEFQSSEIEKTVKELKKKGYYEIEKDDNLVFFWVWQKRLNVEFEAGFAYSVDGTDDLSEIEYLTYQRPLSKENWYYYESDYNEWRSNQHKDSDTTLSDA